MGYDLTNAKNDEFHFNIHSWSPIFQMGMAAGWQPAGTLAPAPFVDEDTGETLGVWDDDEWDGTYFSNDRQRVTDADARAWADALERALDDIPDLHTMPMIVSYVPDELYTEAHLQHEINMRTKAREMRGLPLDEPITALLSKDFVFGTPAPYILVRRSDEWGVVRESPNDYFSGEGKAHVRAFITFLRGGEFTVG